MQYFSLRALESTHKMYAIQYVLLLKPVFEAVTWNVDFFISQSAKQYASFVAC